MSEVRYSTDAAPERPPTFLYEINYGETSETVECDNAYVDGKGIWHFIRFSHGVFMTVNAAQVTWVALRGVR